MQLIQPHMMNAHLFRRIYNYFQEIIYSSIIEFLIMFMSVISIAILFATIGSYFIIGLLFFEF